MIDHKLESGKHSVSGSSAEFGVQRAPREAMVAKPMPDEIVIWNAPRGICGVEFLAATSLLETGVPVGTTKYIRADLKR